MKQSVLHLRSGARLADYGVDFEDGKVKSNIPNQSTLPKGGFGTLIALPLQAEARKVDNSCFVTDDWVPYRDQWVFLSSIRRITKSEIAPVDASKGYPGMTPTCARNEVMADTEARKVKGEIVENRKSDNR